MEIKGALTILCSQVMFADELPLALESFSRRYSEVTVNAMEKDSYYMPVLHERLLQKNDEIVISIFLLPQEKQIGMERIPERFQFHPIYRTQWLACMNAKNHLAKVQKDFHRRFVAGKDYREFSRLPLKLDWIMRC